MGIIEKIKAGQLNPFSFRTKGLEQNRAEMPKGLVAGGSGGLGYGGGYDYYADLYEAIQTGVRGHQRKKINFREEAGDFRFNSLVSICLNWIGTTWPQAPVSIGVRSGAEITALKDADTHPVIRLLRRPNSQYTGKWLTWALNSDFWPTGDSYAHVVTDGRNNLVGNVRELEWLPARFMEPRPDSDGRLSFFRYKPNGTAIDYDPREIVRFRYGIDPANPLRGLSPLLAQDRYIVADNAGGAYSAGTLLNGGLPPAVLVPKPSTAAPNAPGGGGGRITPAEAEQLTQALHEKLRDQPGMIPFIGNAVELLTLGFKPSEMTINELMEEPETRIPAAFGIPPEVLKLRVGLLHSTQENIGESRMAAWQDCLSPTQDMFAEDWTEGLLLPRFGAPENQTVFYDRRAVGVLQPDMTALRKDANMLFMGRILDRAAVKQMIGLPVDETDKGVYYSGPAGAMGQEPDGTASKDDTGSATDATDKSGSSSSGGGKNAQKKTVILLGGGKNRRVSG